MKNITLWLTVIMLLFLITACTDKDDPVIPNEEPPQEEPPPPEITNHFTVLPFGIDTIARIDPIGSNLKVIPVPHTYWHTCDNQTSFYPTGYPCYEPPMIIRSPGDGVIWRIEDYIDGVIKFKVNEGFSWRFHHVNIDPSWNEGDTVRAGDIIGTMYDPNGNNFDFGITNIYVDNTSFFARPERFEENPIYYAQHPIEQFVEPLKSQLISRLPGPTNTIGQVMFDMAGTALGAWFLEGAPLDSEALTVTYEHTQLYLGRRTVNPSTRMIKTRMPFTNLVGGLEDLAVDTNATDWEDITPNSGIHQIRLYLGLQITREPDYNNPMGSLLIEMLDDERLEIEWFDNVTQPTEFTSESRIYVR